MATALTVLLTIAFACLSLLVCFIMGAGVGMMRAEKIASEDKALRDIFKAFREMPKALRVGLVTQLSDDLTDAERVDVVARLTTPTCGPGCGSES